LKGKSQIGIRGIGVQDSKVPCGSAGASSSRFSTGRDLVYLAGAIELSILGDGDFRVRDPDRFSK
jgi:hypothetical protein